MMVHKDVTKGCEGHYNLVDWRSWKLPRVARSSLSAEAQAASEAADTLLYTCIFWKLIWMPHLDLEAPATAHLPHRPCLIVDAKALYDLLTRLEAHAPGGADKRTAIEVLVTQDKLRCACAEILWVSSELQFSDGLTKDSAAHLLAERLRTHMTRVKPDPSFQAAKKKDAAARKAGAEAYAQKRPSRALQAALITTGVQAQTTESISYHLNVIYYVWDSWVPHFLLTVLYVLACLILASYVNGLIRNYMQKPTANHVDQSQQTDDYHDAHETMPEPAAHDEADDRHSPRRRSRTPRHCREREASLRQSLRQLNRQLHDRDEALQSLQGAMNSSQEDRIRQEAIALTQEANHRNLRFTAHGECWHADAGCASRSAKKVLERRPCKLCSQATVQGTGGQASSSNSA